MGGQSLRIVGISAALLSATALTSPASAQIKLDEVFVTATGRAESPSRIVGTTQVITREQVEQSKARSVTDLLSENAVGFLSQWTADQTQIVIRGAITEGQGRDFKSEVLILINGHRAGTANVSKLSIADVDHIEIVRGPSSVVYGSQNMGGIINIILKNGRSAPGVLLEGSGGSWNFGQGRAQWGGSSGKADWYAGVSGSTQGNYSAGRGSAGKELNTSWQRHGETGAVGYQLNEFNRLDMTVRQDGIYNAGFRGSGWSINDVDNRFNGSFDASLTGGLPTGWASWFFQVYGVEDVDALNQPQTFAPNVATHTSADLNTRTQDIVGQRLQPRFNFWQGNDLLVGYDHESEMLRSTRYDLGILNAPVAQPAPTDNNQHVNENAFYFEDAQTFLDDKLTVRGGLRKTLGTTTLDATPNVSPPLLVSAHDYQTTTYSGGAAWRATDWLSTRVAASSGFRAPTATELGANFITASSGTQTLGNPSISPEKSAQMEAGATATWAGSSLDLALFQNRIMDRITTRAIGVTSTGATISQSINNPGAIVMQGIEAQYSFDVFKNLKMVNAFNAPDNWFWSIYGSGYYNFRMKDEGLTFVIPSATIDKPLRMYESQLALNTRFGQHGDAWHDWAFQVTGIFNGRMWYNTEEHLTIPGQVASTTIFLKSPYIVWNLRGELKVYEGVTWWGKVDNLFNLNYQPIFIALYNVPCIGDPRFSNGSCGNSAPGRTYVTGLTARF